MANGESFCHLNNDDDVDDDDHEDDDDVDDDDDKWRVRVCCCSSCELELPQLPCVLLSIRLTSQWSSQSSQWSSQSSGFHFSSCNDVNGAAIAKAKEEVEPQISIVGSIRALVHRPVFPSGGIANESGEAWCGYCQIGGDQTILTSGLGCRSICLWF